MAICRGPEVGEFWYSYCDSEQLCASTFGNEAAAVEDLRVRVHNEFNLCESRVEYPPFMPMPSSLTTTYKLNALGQRVRKTSAGVSTYFVYDDAGHLVGEYDDSGALIQETIWFGDIPVGVLKSNGSGGVNLFYVHTDHLNTPEDQPAKRQRDRVAMGFGSVRYDCCEPGSRWR
jgi:hypothetical protein